MAYTAAEGLRMFAACRPDLLILDWMLPDGSGIDLCRKITEQYNLPIIMLTARSHMDDKVEGLEAGADDYITKPFELREVVVRVKAILRRIGKIRQQKEKQENILTAPPLRVNTGERLVWCHGRKAELTPREYDLLLYLLEHPHQVFTRDLLLEQVWGYDYLGDSRTVDTHIQRLRKKLDLAEQIQTVFGVGYKYLPS